MDNTAHKSSILLLNLGLDSDKCAIKKVGVRELKAIFAEYGRLRKIIVFTRKVLLKAFLEYEDISQAEAAKAAVHETVIGNYGKARLYFSPMEKLEFSNKYLEFWEDSASAKQSRADDDTSTKHSYKNSLSKFSHMFSNRKENYGVTGAEHKSLHQTPILCNDSSDSIRINANKNNVFINKSVFSGSNQQFYNKSQTVVLHDSLTNNNDVHTQALHNTSCSMQSSCVVLVSNLGHVFKNTDELFNIFSAFGNINKILFMTNLQKAMIEYSSVQFASTAIANLNDLSLGETCLRVSFSKYRTIALEKSSTNEASAQYNQTLVVPHVRNRYNAESPLSPIVPLSSTLLISYICNGRTQTLDVYLAIERLCKPVKTKLVRKSTAENEPPSVSMLFSFKEIQSAVYVMYKCHNSVVKGALLDIFFF